MPTRRTDLAALIMGNVTSGSAGGLFEEFGCEIPDDAAETILTVGDATKFLEKNAKS